VQCVASDGKLIHHSKGLTYLFCFRSAGSENIMIIQLLMILQLLIIFICEKEERNVDFLFIVLFSFFKHNDQKNPK